MARGTAMFERVVVDELDALLCDICGVEYARATHPDEAAPYRGSSARPPAGSGAFVIYEKEADVANLRKMDLCVGCAGVLWDELQTRKKV